MDSMKSIGFEELGRRELLKVDLVKVLAVVVVAAAVYLYCEAYPEKCIVDAIR